MASLTEYDVQPILHGDGRDIRNKLSEIAYQYALQNAYSYADSMSLKSNLEKELAAQYIGGRTGKVFATKIWHYATNTSSAGEALLDSIGLTCTPATDTVQGQDDYADASEIFQWTRCNYVRDDDGFARPTALEGTPAFKKSGSVDVGNVYATFWYKVENRGTYDIYYMSDSPHQDLGLVPWYEACKADGTVLPFYVHSAFYSCTASDGLLRSQPEMAPAYNNSYNSMITAYQKKGSGYWGAGSERTLFGFLMLVIKYKTKNSQKYFAGCSSFTAQVKCAVAETDVKRILLSDQSQFYVGACVSVGTLNNGSYDRNYSSMHSIADRVKVTSIEQVTVDSTLYTALNLDLDSTITTTTDTYVSTMPCMTGETDAVIGHFDGSYLSNTDACHTYRICGTEYQNGEGIIDSNVIMKRDEAAGLWRVFAAPRGTAHVANATTGFTQLPGGIPIASGDYYSGDIYVDPTTGTFYPVTIGSGDRTGTGDTVAGPQSGAGDDGTLREHYTLGNLGSSVHSGLACVYCGYGLGGAGWAFGSCD